MRADRYYIHRSKSGTRHIATEEDLSLCGQEIIVNALAVGTLYNSKHLDDIEAEATCKTCLRRWREYVPDTHAGSAQRNVRR